MDQTATGMPAPNTAVVPAQTDASTTIKRSPNLFISIVKLVLAIVFLVASMVGQAMVYYIAWDYIYDDILLMTVYEIGGFVCAIVGCLLLGGWRHVGFSFDDIGAAFKSCWWLIIIDTGTALFYLGELWFYGELVPVEGWGEYLATTLFLCLFVGLCEEGMFRGLILGGLQSVFGGTKIGIHVAVFLSALVFGLVHVLPPDESDLTPLGITQMVLKTLQTGICGYLWAAIVIQNNSRIWGVSLVHAYVDFVIMGASAVFEGEDSVTSTDYVSTDEEAWGTIIFYIILIVLYLPALVRAIKIMKTIEAPQFGMFEKDYPIVVNANGAAAVAAIPASPVSGLGSEAVYGVPLEGGGVQQMGQTPSQGYAPQTANSYNPMPTTAAIQSAMQDPSMSEAIQFGNQYVAQTPVQSTTHASEQVSIPEPMPEPPYAPQVDSPIPSAPAPDVDPVGGSEDPQFS